MFVVISVTVLGLVELELGVMPSALQDARSLTSELDFERVAAHPWRVQAWRALHKATRPPMRTHQQHNTGASETGDKMAEC